MIDISLFVTTNSGYLLLQTIKISIMKLFYVPLLASEVSSSSRARFHARAIKLGLGGIFINVLIAKEQGCIQLVTPPSKHANTWIMMNK